MRIARTADDIAGAQRLRYRVFVEEMGASASPDDSAARLERDKFDPFFDHLVLVDETSPIEDPLDRVVGAYRLMRGAAAEAGIGFYSADEYDLSKLVAYQGEVLELGRSCVAKEHRNGLAMHQLWAGLGEYVITRNIAVLFGVASFHGTDLAPLGQPLSYLHYNHMAPEPLRVRTVPGAFTPMNVLPEASVDKRQALRDMPPLIKSYLRLGGTVGEGAFVDHLFNTVDVCLIMDTTQMQAKYRETYSRGGVLE